MFLFAPLALAAGDLASEDSKIKQGIALLGGLIGLGEPERVVSREQFYAGAKVGTVFCPGPYDVATVVAKLALHPTQRARFDSVIAQDSLAQSNGPYSDLGRAGVLVGWAHGGTACAVTGDANNTRAIQALDELLALPDPKPEQAALTPFGGVGGVSLTTPTGGVNPLVIVAGVLLLGRLL